MLQIWPEPPQAHAHSQLLAAAGNFCVVHVSLVPVIGVVGEQKTKPTQQSVATLRSLGLNPAILACRSSDPLGDSVKEKLVGEGGWQGTALSGGRLAGHGLLAGRGFEQGESGRAWAAGRARL